MEAIADYLSTDVFQSHVKQYPKGQILLYKGDLPLDVMVLRNGVIKLYDIDDQDNEKILHLVRPFAVIPFAFFSGGNEPMHWYYGALTDCEVSVIPFEDFQRRMEENSELAWELMNWFSIEVHELLVRLSSLGKSSAENKIKAALRFLAVHHSKKINDQWVRVNFNVNHQLISDLVGVTRERAAMIMKELSDKQEIRTPRQNVLELNQAALLD